METKMPDVMEQSVAELTFRRPNKLAVVGADLDLALCGSLTEGDAVLVESNGQRYGGDEDSNPMIVRNPWFVVENSYSIDSKGISGYPEKVSGLLVLHNHLHDDDLRLDYEALANFKRETPCVFLSDFYDGGTQYIILQLVSHYESEDRLDEYRVIPNTELAEFSELLSDPDTKSAILNRLQSVTKQFVDGWGRLSERRFALMANVRVAAVRAIKANNVIAMANLTDGELGRLYKASYWLPKLFAQSSLIAHDYHATFVRPNLGATSDGSSHKGRCI
jgi:hypothetical protein